jgi:hypothetical protein
VNSARHHADGEAHNGDTTAILRRADAPITYADVDRSLDELRNDRRDAAASLLASKAPAPVFRVDPIRPRSLYVLLGCALIMAVSIPWWVGFGVIFLWLGGWL